MTTWRTLRAGDVAHATWFGSLSGSRFTETISRALTAIYAERPGARLFIPHHGSIGASAYGITGQGTDSFKLKSNVDVVFEPGTNMVISGMSSTGGAGYVLFADSTSEDIENVRVLGNGLKITGDKTTALSQFLISVNAQNVGDICRSIYFHDILLENSWMDGVYVGGNVGSFHEDIQFHRLKVTGCRRNGGSVTHGKSIRFYDCKFDDNGDGQSPEAGFDIEVNNATSGVYVALDIEFYRCTFSGNNGTGLIAQAPSYGTNARVRLIDCDANENGGYGVIAGIRGMVVRGCNAHRNTIDGIYKSEDAQISDCRCDDNGGDGFSGIMASEEQGFVNNVARYNVGDGFLLNSFEQSGGAIRLIGCHASWNGGRGANLSGASDAQIIGGTFVGNVNEGIRFANARSCTVQGATIEGNSVNTDLAADNVIFESGASFNSIVGGTIRQSARYHRGNAVVDATYTTTTKVKLAVYASTTTDFYKAYYFRIRSGTQSGREGWCTAYDGTNQSATVYWTGAGTVAGALAAAPDATSVIEIVGTRTLTYVTVASATATTVVLPSDLSPSRNDKFNGHTLWVKSGTGAGQFVDISDYDGPSRTLTVATLSPVPDDTSVVEIISKNRPRNAWRVSGSSCYENTIMTVDYKDGGGSADFSNTGTTTHFEASGTATYDPPNLVDGAGASTTVTVTGAALGDVATASFSLDLQGITLTAYVSAANTVTVRFQNESGGALDLASGTVLARVRK